MDKTQQSLQSILDALLAMPAAQAVFLMTFLVFLIVAGNAVFALHYRRVGKPVVKSILDPTSFPLFNFNARELLLLAGVLVLSAILGLLAVWAG